LYVLIALAIASGVEGSNYTNQSSLDLAAKLAKAYGVICSPSLNDLTLDIFLLTINVIQWGALWFGARMGGDVFSICCSIALFFVYIKAIYLIVSAWVTGISLRNPFIVLSQWIRLITERRMVRWRSICTGLFGGFVVYCRWSHGEP
jgi:hypothetical protein